jgi:hypothetical protein
MADSTTNADEPPLREGAEDRLDRAQRTLPRRRFFSDMPDKGLFALIAILGFSGILIFKLRGLDADFVAGGAVALMVIYGFVAFQFRRIRLRPDRLGDNFYYLGFIYTLASLSAALLQIRRGASIDDLLGSFGIALFTTIIGVAGRVLFVQMRGDIDEVEDEVRKDLLSASADLRAQLNITLAEFETFQTGVQQATRKAAEQSTTAVQDGISNISRVANAAAEKIDQAFIGEVDKVRAFEQSVLRIENGLKSLTSELNDRFYDLADSVERMVAQLAAAIDLVNRKKRKFRLWPFGRK